MTDRPGPISGGGLKPLGMIDTDCRPAREGRALRAPFRTIPSPGSRNPGHPRHWKRQSLNAGAAAQFRRPATTCASLGCWEQGPIRRADPGRKTVNRCQTNLARRNRGYHELIHANYGSGLGVAVRQTAGIAVTSGQSALRPGGCTYWWGDPREQPQWRMVSAPEFRTALQVPTNDRTPPIRQFSIEALPLGRSADIEAPLEMARASPTGDRGAAR
jgi:hypothetical protein